MTVNSTVRNGPHLKGGGVQVGDGDEDEVVLHDEEKRGHTHLEEVPGLTEEVLVKMESPQPGTPLLHQHEQEAGQRLDQLGQQHGC